MEIYASHCQSIFCKMKDVRVLTNLKSLLSKMQVDFTTQLWTLSENTQEYNRFVNLLNGELKNGLTPEMINDSLLKSSVSNIKFNKTLYIIHDGCSILKPESKVQKDLHKVKNLDNNFVNGYMTFNTICVSDIDKKIHLLQCKAYSTNPYSGYNQMLVGYSEQEIIEEQIKLVDQSLKSYFPDVNLIHLLDRKHDDKKLFSFISNLGSKFVIRGKLNRNSNEIILTEEINEAGEIKIKERKIKLVEANLTSKKIEVLEKFVWKGKVYQQAKLESRYGNVIIESKTYNVVIIQIYDRTGRKLFALPIVLITNIEVSNHQMAFEVYQFYLIRSKIEGVFKFLKQELGWQEFRVKDFLVIQNIIVLCFFVGEYFYETKHELTKDKNVIMICKLAKSKDKVTPHFYKKGLAVIANYILFQEYVKENNITQEQINELIEHVLQKK